MKRLTLLASAAMLLSGCIVLDELTTITVRPDGSSHVVAFHSNVRSTEEGSKAREELTRYAAEFDARTSEDFTRISQAGGEVVEARWIRNEVPYSNLIAAKFQTPAQLEKYFTIEGKEDDVRLTTRFSQDGRRRKVTMVALPPKDLNIADLSEAAKQTRQRQANGISETRVVVTDGQIVASQGWTVASDKASAILALDEIEQLLRKSPRQIELFIEWEVHGQ